MQTVQIRDARPEDAPHLLEIYAHYVKNTAVSFEYEVPTLSEFEVRICRTMARYPYLVAEQAGAVRGYAYAGPFIGRAAYDWACETTIYLHPDARRQGLGRALYGALEERLREMGVVDLYACIGLPRQEDDAYLSGDSAKFHARMGYSETGRFHRCGYKFGRWYDMIWVGKSIGEHRQPQPPVRFGPRR